MISIVYRWIEKSPNHQFFRPCCSELITEEILKRETLSRGELTAATAPASRGISLIIVQERSSLRVKHRDQVLPRSSLVEVKSGQASSCHRIMMLVVAPPGLSPDWGDLVGRRRGGGMQRAESSPEILPDPLPR